MSIHNICFYSEIRKYSLDNPSLNLSNLCGSKVEKCQTLSTITIGLRPRMASPDTIFTLSIRREKANGLAHQILRKSGI